MSNLDKDLLKLYAENSNKGFKAIVDVFQEQVYWQIRRMTKNHSDSQDVMQNIFIKVWKGLPKFKGDSALYSWLYRITYNETITFINKQSKKRTVQLDQSLIENGVSVNGKNWSSDEISDILMKAIENLPEKQAQVFQLKYFDDLKYTDISELLGTSVGGLKASYHIAVKKIEDYIKTI